MNVELSIIIVNWNSKPFVEACVRSIFEQARHLNFEIIVLDNASCDGCGEMLAAKFPDVIFLQCDQNLGFSKGNNRAAQLARGDVLLFLNPDTEVRPGAIQRLLAVTRSKPDAGAVGARLLNSDGSLQESCLQAFPTILNQMADADLLRRWFPRWPLWGTLPLYSGKAEAEAVEGISGACIMTPKSVFNDVGGFSENYFMYFEDMDYCLKASKAGRTNYFVPQAEIVHHGGKSATTAAGKFSSVMMAESAWRFFVKEHGPGSAGLFRFCLALKAISRSLAVALLYVTARTAPRRTRLKSAFCKWKWVARWALGGESWAGNY
jgi:GT2 family glycosyltransferase